MKHPIPNADIFNILRKSGEIVRDNIWLFLGINFLTIATTQIGIELATAWLDEESILFFVIALAYLTGLSLVVLPINAAAMTYAVANTMISRRVSISSCFREGLQRPQPLFWIQFLYCVLVFGGICLFLVPGILFACWFSNAMSVVLLEGKTGREALARSKELMQGNNLTLVGIFVVLTVAFFPARHGITKIPEPITRALLDTVVNTLEGLALSTNFIVLYFACRKQHETFNLKMLASAIGVVTEKPPPEPKVQKSRPRLEELDESS